MIFYIQFSYESMYNIIFFTRHVPVIFTQNRQLVGMKKKKIIST